MHLPLPLAPARPATSLRRRTATLASGVAVLALGASLLAPGAAVGATRDEVELAFGFAGVAYGKSVDTADYARAARRFGVDVGVHIDGTDIDRIVAAAWGSTGERFGLAGIGVGARPDPSDLVDGAARLGIGYGTKLDLHDGERILGAGRAELARGLRAGGVDYGTRLDHEDLRNAGRRLGAPVGKRIDPADSRRIVDAAWRKASSPLLAKANGVRVYSPSPRAVHIGFHQAASGSARPMRAALGAKMPSRGRGTAGTSAVDVALAKGDPVRAPVTGRVVEVDRYALYGRYGDVRIRIVPDDNPRMLVTVLHVTGPKVRVGQRIRGGADLIARGARKFPFYSQIDGLGGRGNGHVHVEMRRR